MRNPATDVRFVVLACFFRRSLVRQFQPVSAVFDSQLTPVLTPVSSVRDVAPMTARVR